ncbi:hypothetical protein K491DRAFT_675093 [Lophiostoma macrostomum CBS 122681]|uniref:Uncharacterized protein n=1 Tax=Lophiostoma macrostomum CBS 122681 TaxID=1314788 RepID=A0A6A6TJJ7_9PLEO|nr:hypothetical protein K491DRAFT_675093 [Lophiostoma macrostomum CBS 122681]
MVDLRSFHDAQEDDNDDNHSFGDDTLTGPPTGPPTDFPFSTNMVIPTSFPSSLLSRFSTYPNGGDISRGRPSTLQTSPSSYTTNPPGPTDVTQSPSPTITDSGTHSTSAFAGTVQGQDDGGNDGDKGHGNGGVKVAAGAIPAVLLVIGAIVAFLWMRRRKRQRQLATQQAHTEMKAGPGAFVAAHYESSPPSPPSAIQPQVVMSSSQAAPPANLAPPQPVILGPIGSGSNGAYFTGIDTSDAMSTTNDRTGLGNPFADGDSLAEEPPPPYRPRSMATSRNSSMRVPPSVHSQTSLVVNGSQPVRSPFADPDEDDGVSVSDVSGPTLGRNHEDALSVVSDLSYQHEPVAGRPSA